MSEQEITPTDENSTETTESVESAATADVAETATASVESTATTDAAEPTTASVESAATADTAETITDTAEAAATSAPVAPPAPAKPVAQRPPAASSKYDDEDDYDDEDENAYDDYDEDEDDDPELDARGRFGVPTDYVPSTQRGRSRRIHIDIKVEDLHYKNIPLLTRFLDTRGRILSRRKTGVSAKVQRKAVTAIKRARHLALMPYTAEHTRVTRLKKRG